MKTNKSISKNSFYNIIYVGINLLFPLITSSYIARILLPENLGKVSYAQNLASYFVTFASLGLPSYGVREISKVRNNSKELNVTYTELLVINIISSLVCAAIYFFLVIGVPGYRKSLLLYAACGLPILLNVINVDWLYQGLEEYRYITLRSVIIKIFSLLAVLMFIHQMSDYVLYAFIVSLATVGNYVFNIVHARKIVKFTIVNCHLKKHIKPLFNFALILFLSSIYSRIDILMLGSMATHESIGYYSYAQKIINIVLSVCNAATSVLMPRLSLYYIEDKEQFDVLLEKGIKIITFIVFPICVGLFILSKDVIILLFGNAFAESAITVRIFVPILLIKTYGDLLCYQVIIATNNEVQNIKASAIGSCINVVCNALLIPVFMEKGAAIASVLAEFSLNLYEFIFTKKHVGYKIPTKNIVQAIGSSAIMGAVVYMCTRTLKNRLIIVIIGFIAGVVVYSLVNAIMKNDIFSEFMRRIIRQKKERYA